MNDEPAETGTSGEDARIEALEKRLAAAKEREEKRNQPAVGAGADANYSMGNRVLAELIGGIGGGAFFGWVIDRFAGTTPWGLLVVMFLGIIVAFRNIIRISNRQSD